MHCLRAASLSRGPYWIYRTAHHSCEFCTPLSLRVHFHCSYCLSQPFCESQRSFETYLTDFIYDLGLQDQPLSSSSAFGQAPGSAPSSVSPSPPLRRSRLSSPIAGQPELPCIRAPVGPHTQSPARRALSVVPHRTAVSPPRRLPSDVFHESTASVDHVHSARHAVPEQPPMSASSQALPSVHSLTHGLYSPSGPSPSSHLGYTPSASSSLTNHGPWSSSSRNSAPRDIYEFSHREGFNPMSSWSNE